MDYKKLVRVIDNVVDRPLDGEKVSGGYLLYNSDDANADDMWEEFYREVLPEMDKCGAYVLTGKRGNRNIAADVYEDLGSVIHACIPNGIQSGVVISTTDDGGIEVRVEGLGNFEIHGLNAEGVELHDVGNDDELGDPKYWGWMLD